MHPPQQEPIIAKGSGDWRLWQLSDCLGLVKTVRGYFYTDELYDELTDLQLRFFELYEASSRPATVRRISDMDSSIASVELIQIS